MAFCSMKRHISQYDMPPFAPCNMEAASMSKKVFVKNSSLVTSWFNVLFVRMLWCDELISELVTAGDSRACVTSWNLNSSHSNAL